MEVRIIGYGKFKPSMLDQLVDDGSFRKATKNMLMCYLAMQEALASSELASSIYNNFDPSDIGLFVGTGHGELDATMQFLKSIGIEHRSRPFLFQNGLHNATLGFLSLKLQHTGPGFTLSNGHYSGEDALGLAFDWCNSERIKVAVVVGYDSIPETVTECFQDLYPDQLHLVEGAGVLILANYLNGDKRFPLLKEITVCERADLNHFPFDFSQGFYDGNAIEKVVDSILKQSELEKIQNIQLYKPDQTSTFISLEF